MVATAPVVTIVSVVAVTLNEAMDALFSRHKRNGSAVVKKLFSALLCSFATEKPVVAPEATVVLVPSVALLLSVSGRYGAAVTVVGWCDYENCVVCSGCHACDVPGTFVISSVRVVYD